MKRVAAVSVLSVLVGVCLVVWNEIRHFGRLLSDAIGGKP